MYYELIKRLRDNAEFLVKASSGCLSNSFADTMCQAADAIEELIKRLNHADDQIERLVNAAEDRRWIPVTERLPDMHMVHSEYGCGDYMISDAVAIYAIDLGETPEVFCGMYEKDLGEDGFEGWTNCEGYSFNTVTHWMPLPEPPKEDG